MDDWENFRRISCFAEREQYTEVSKEYAVFCQRDSNPINSIKHLIEVLEAMVLT